MKQLQELTPSGLKPWVVPAYYGTPQETEEVLANGLRLAVVEYPLSPYAGTVGVGLQGQLVATPRSRGRSLEQPLAAFKELLERLSPEVATTATPEELAALRMPLQDFLETVEGLHFGSSGEASPLEYCLGLMLTSILAGPLPGETKRQEEAKRFLERFPLSEITSWVRLRHYLRPTSLLQGWEGAPYLSLLAQPTPYLKLKEAAWSEVVECLKLLQQAGPVEEEEVVFPLQNKGYRSFLLTLKPEELTLLRKPLEERISAPVAVQAAYGEYLRGQLKLQEGEGRLTPAEQASAVVRCVMEQAAAKRKWSLPFQATEAFSEDIFKASRLLESLKASPTALEVVASYLQTDGKVEPLGGLTVLRVLFYRGVPEYDEVEAGKLRCLYDWLRDPNDVEFVLSSLRAKGLSPETILRLIHKIAFSEKVFTTIDWLNLIAQWQEDFMDYPGDWLGKLLKGERKLLKQEETA